MIGGVGWKGFENFFPKNRGARPSKKSHSSKNAKEETKKENVFSNFDKHKKKNSGSGGPAGGGDDQQHVGAIAALLLLVLTGRAFLEEDSNINGREVRTLQLHPSFKYTIFSSKHDNLFISQ